MVNFVIALACEARPIVERYELKAIPRSEPFRVYEGNDKRLIVSGVGKIRTASAAAFLHAFSGALRNQVWINLGIGGHSERAIGEGVLAHKITDHASGQSWYPPILFEPSCATESILTVDRPETEYREPWVYEMEAAGFYDTASRFSTSELVQCYKMISDNRKSTSEKVSAPFVERLIKNNLEAVDTMVDRITKLARELERAEPAVPEFQKFLERWHFTVSEQYRLGRLLKRFRTLAPEHGIWSDELLALAKPKDVLRFLEDRISSLPVRL